VSFLAVSAGAGAGVATLVVSFAVVSLLLVFFCELQPAAIDPAIAAINAKFKMCFFIGVPINLSILLIALYNIETFAIVCKIFFIYN
jgi:hypothetical protein